MKYLAAIKRKKPRFSKVFKHLNLVLVIFLMTVLSVIRPLTGADNAAFDAACLTAEHDIKKELGLWCLENKLYAEGRQYLEQLPKDTKFEKTEKKLIRKTKKKKSKKLPSKSLQTEFNTKRAQCYRRLLEKLDDLTVEHDVDEKSDQFQLRHFDYLAKTIPFQLVGYGNKIKKNDLAKLSRTLGIINRALPKALKKIQGKLQFKMDPDAPFQIELLRTPRQGSTMLAHVDVRPGKQPVMRIFVANWHKRHSEESLTGTLTHESVHAMQAITMGTQRYSFSIPNWYREGLAVFIAGDGKDHVQWCYSLLKQQKKPFSDCLNGLEPGNAGQNFPYDYAEAFLSLEYLEDEFGHDELFKFFHDIHFTNSTFSQMLKKHYKMEYADFALKSNIHVKESYKHHIKDMGNWIVPGASQSDHD